MRDPMVIEGRPPTLRERLSQRLRGRRILISALIALIEVIAFVIWRPNTLLMAALALVLLVIFTSLAMRAEKGLLRDVLVILALSQGIVVIVPLAIGISVVAGLIIAVALLVALVAVAARWRL